MLPLSRSAATVLASLVAIALPASASAAGACTKNWAGTATTAGLLSGDWSVGANWAPAGLPGPTDIVCVPANSATTLDTALTVVAIRTEGEIKSQSAPPLTLTGVGGELSRVKKLTLDGSLIGEGDLEADDLRWGYGVWTGTGTVTVKNSMLVYSGSGGHAIQSGRTLITEGTGDYQASIGGYGTARWINRAVNTMAGVDFDAIAVGGVLPTLHNEPGGSFTKVSGTNNFNIGFSTDNDGVIARLPEPPGQPGVSTGRLYIEADAAQISDGSFDRVVITDSHNSAGDYTAPGNLDLVLGPNASINRSILQGDVRVAPGRTWSMDGMSIQGGSIWGDATFEFTGAFDAYYGVVGTSDSIVKFVAGSVTDWHAAFGLYARRVETHGTLTINGTGAGTVDNIGRRMIWENDGTLELKVGQLALVGAPDEYARIINRGTIKVAAYPSVFTIEAWLVNLGTIEVSSGFLTAPRFEQTVDGTTRFLIGGPALNTNYGQVISSSLRYSGRLEAAYVGGYAPPVGTRFNVFSASSTTRSGQFLTSALPSMTLDESVAGNIGVVAAVSAASVGPVTSVGLSLHPAPVQASSASEPDGAARPASSAAVATLSAQTAAAKTNAAKRIKATKKAKRISKKAKLRAKSAKRKASQRRPSAKAK